MSTNSSLEDRPPPTAPYSSIYLCLLQSGIHPPFSECLTRIAQLVKREQGPCNSALGKNRIVKLTLLFYSIFHRHMFQMQHRPACTSWKALWTYCSCFVHRQCANQQWSIAHGRAYRASGRSFYTRVSCLWLSSLSSATLITVTSLGKGGSIECSSFFCK